jgi:hypothetical protein
MPAVFVYTGSVVRRGALVLLFVLAVAAIAGAAQRTLTASDIEAALRIGHTSIAADRARFHAPYRIPVSQPPVDFIEVVTPFRRVVIAADERARFGDRSFGQRQALELLSAAAGRFDFRVELTFHPLNTFVTMPEYGVVLVRDGMRIAPAVLERQPRFGLRVENLPPSIPVVGGLIPNSGSQPLLGGTLIAQFEGEALDAAGTVDVIVTDGPKELANVKIDLGRLR